MAKGTKLTGFEKGEMKGDSEKRGKISERDFEGLRTQ